MKYYHRRVYSDYRKDLVSIKRYGMPDTIDSLILSKEFAYWAPHIMEMAHRKNVEYASVGVLDRNDLIQIVSECFLIAWNRVNWDRINRIPADERQKSLWGFIKKNVGLDLAKKIREVKDGIKVPVREQFEFSDQLGKVTAEFDAVTSLFPQFKLEVGFAHLAQEETSYNNERLVDILQSHFNKYIKNHKHIYVLERSLGVDGDKMTSKEIADRMGSSEMSVNNMRSKALKSLKSKESMRELAFVLDGAMIETGANILEILK